MAKAINWPQEFYEEIIAEDMDSSRIALRVGSIYFDNSYYTPDEVVDIRVNHKIVRQGQILGNMKLLKIKELSENDMAKYKKSMSNTTEIIKFLEKNYGQYFLNINEETEVTLITYKNLDMTNPDDDDPHM